MNKLIQKLKPLFRLSDLFLFIGFLPFAIYLIFGQIFMQHSNPSEVALPLWLAIILFVIAMGCWGFYLFLEFKKYDNAPKRCVTYIFIFIALINIIAIIVQPEMVTNDVICRNVNDASIGRYIGEVVTVSTPVSVTHKIFFIMDLILILSFMYIGYFIFSKRIKTIKFIKYIGYAMIGFTLFIILYSYITEHANYGPFLQALFAGDTEKMVLYSMKSLIIHRNAYGMVMLLGIIFAFINHSMEKKWWYYLLAAFFFINMIFSWSKTSLIIGVLIFLIYIYYRLIVTYRDNVKRNRTVLITLSLVLLIIVGVVGISYVSKGKYAPQIYSIIGGHGETLDLRLYIWDNSFILLRNGWWLIGRGFGTYNTILYDMNAVNGDIVFPAHNAYIGLLAEGGIFYLFAYFCLLAYSIKIIIADYKKSPELTVAMTLGVLAFFLYCNIEAIQYLVYIFLLPLYILYYSPEENKEVK